MYIRVTERKNRDGSTVQYVQLAHNERDPQKGHPVARILYNFGRADQLDLDALRRLVRSIHRFLSPEEALQNQAQTSGAPLPFKSSRPLGGAWALDGLWRQLGIPAALGALLKQRQFRTPIERTLFALAANRALAPASKLAVEDWVADDVALPGLQEVEVQQLYRTMDFLLEAGERLQEAVYFSVADLLNLEVDLLYFGALCQGPGASLQQAA